MSKYKIKKRNANHFSFKERSPLEIAIMLIPLILAIIVAVVLVVVISTKSGNVSQANRELLLSTNGHWEKFADYGIMAWCPNNIEEEDLGSDLSKTQRLFVIRDKGEYPEIAFGVILVDDVEGRTFDLENDPAGVLDVTTPVLTDVFGKMINGAYPTFSVDIEQITLSTGEAAISGSGTANVILVLQDPKDPENPYTEEAMLNLYYIVKTYHGRPVIVWGTWDYIVVEGDVRTQEAVMDGAVSIMNIPGEESVDPEEDSWVDVVPKYQVINGEKQVSTSNNESFLWDEETRQWISTTTGEVNESLPPADDAYWDDKTVVESEAPTSDVEATYTPVPQPSGELPTDPDWE